MSDSTDKMWGKVSACREKIAIQREKKKEESQSSSSGFSSPNVMPIPFFELSSCSFDNAASNVCTNT